MKKTLSFFLLLMLLGSVVCSGQSLQLADSLRSKGENLHDLGKLREAEFYYKEAYQLYRQHRDTAALIKTGMFYAEVLYRRSKYEESISLFNTLTEIDHATRDTLLARMEYTLGMAKERTGHLDESVMHFEKALALAQESKDSLMVGYTLQSIADNYQDIGNYSKALSAYRETVPILEGIGNLGGLSTAYKNIGSVYRDLLLYDKALEYFNKSLEIRKGLQNVDLLSIGYLNIGDIQKDLGNYDQALMAYQKSLEYANMAGSPLRRAIVLNNIGTLYSQIGNPKRALEYYEESLSIRQKIQPPSQFATLYGNIANRRFELGDVQQAAEYYETILSIRREQGNKREIARTLLDLAKVEDKNANLQQALEYANQAFAIADSAKDYSQLSDASAWLGHIQRSMGNSSQALSHYKESLAYSRFLNKKSQINPLMQVARAYHQLNSDSALAYGHEAIQLIEEGRSSTGANSAIKSDYFKQYSDFYIDMAAWTLKYKQDQAGAYALVEQAKARTLSDELVQASQRIDEQLPDSIRIERNGMLNNIDGLYSKLQLTQDEEERKQLQNTIRKRELEYAAYQNELHEKYPSYKKLELQKPVGLDRAQSVNSNQTATLEYAMNDEHLLVFFITEDGTSVRHYNLSELTSMQAKSLLEQVQQYKDAILAHAERSELNLLSDRLYGILVEPFEDQLDEYPNLIIVPDGPLAYLPFEALRHNNRYMIERHYIKYVPSVTSLTLMKDPQHEQQKQLLAVAGSEVMNIDSKTGQRISSLSSLPFTMVEVDSIASHFNSVTTLKEESVTEGALKRYLNEDYRYIHLATHGYIDEDEPTQSGLRLSGTQGLEVSSAEDGLLKSSEIYRLNLNSDMVVLSACNTGIGKVVKGEGMLGLQRAFFYAGTSSVVVSLWNVYDRSTAYLMNEFYKAILSGDYDSDDSWAKQMLRWAGWETSIPFGEKAAAMRTAKLNLISHPLYNHPVYWAPFIVVGR